MPSFVDSQRTSNYPGMISGDSHYKLILSPEGNKERNKSSLVLLIHLLQAARARKWSLIECKNMPTGGVGEHILIIFRIVPHWKLYWNRWILSVVVALVHSSECWRHTGRYPNNGKLKSPKRSVGVLLWSTLCTTTTGYIKSAWEDKSCRRWIKGLGDTSYTYHNTFTTSAFSSRYGPKFWTCDGRWMEKSCKGLGHKSGGAQQKICYIRFTW